ncbi:unnamed protein product [Candida parapsilosis]
MSAHEPTSHCQVYIKNLHYLTTEDDLRTLFEKYNPVSIIVPSYTVKLGKNGKRKPYGFAYVELSTSQHVEEAVKEFDGSVFNGKKLIVKAYQPYKPYQKLWWRRTKPTEETQNHDAPDAELLADAVSKDRILITNIRGRVNYVRVEHFLMKYNPSDIIICKDKKSIMNPIKLTGTYYSALVTVDTSTKSVKEIIESLKSTKLCGKRVELMPATLKQVEEFEKEAILQGFPHEGLERIPDVETEQVSPEQVPPEQVSPAVPMELNSPAPTSMIVSPGSTISSNFNGRINSP